MGRPRIYANPSERTKAWKKANPERTSEHTRRSVAKWRLLNPDKDRHAKMKERESYGLSLDELQAMAERQNSLCAICGQSCPLVVDHDHATGIVRGLLCRMCNVGLGMFRDDVERLISAAAYLEAVRS